MRVTAAGIALGVAGIIALSGCVKPEVRPNPKLDDGATFDLMRSADLKRRRSEIEAFWNAADNHRDPALPKTFPGVGEKDIAFRYWRKAGESPAVVISSGRTEHMGKYREVVYDFWRNGYSVYIHDHRGQGESARLLGDQERRQMGHVEDFKHYVADLHTFVEGFVLRSRHPSRFLIGHSMGGGIATLYLLDHPEAFDAAVLTSPMHQPDTSPLRLLGCWFMTSTEGWRSDQWVIGTGRYEKKAHSGAQIYTTDPIRYNAWFASERVTPNDARIGGMSRKWVAQACRASAEMLSRASTLKVPVMLLQSVADEAVVPAAQDRFCQAIPMPANVPPSAPGCHPQGLPISYADAKHELLIERDEIRMDAMRRTLAFFSQQRALAKSRPTGS